MTWTNIVTLLPIKDENKRNYYINLCIKEQLSKRELVSRIKNEYYERLVNKPEKIDIVCLGTKREYDILDEIKSPIVIKLGKDDKPKNEEELQVLLLAHLKNVLEELGQGFTYVGNEYKIKHGNKVCLLKMRVNILLYR